MLPMVLVIANVTLLTVLAYLHLDNMHTVQHLSRWLHRLSRVPAHVATDDVAADGQLNGDGSDRLLILLHTAICTAPLVAMVFKKATLSAVADCDSSLNASADNECCPCSSVMAQYIDQHCAGLEATQVDA